MSIINTLSFFYRHVVLHGRQHTPHPFAISLFEDKVFYSDWTRMSLKKVNKYTGANSVVELHRNETAQIVDVAVIHPIKQPAGTTSVMFHYFLSLKLST